MTRRLSSSPPPTTNPPPKKVLRGYVGDRNAPPVFDAPDDPLAQAFGAVFGRDAGQRPLELAAQRLLNMIAVLRNCEFSLVLVVGCLVLFSCFDGAAAAGCFCGVLFLLVA